MSELFLVPSIMLYCDLSCELRLLKWRFPLSHSLAVSWLPMTRIALPVGDSRSSTLWFSCDALFLAASWLPMPRIALSHSWSCLRFPSTLIVVALSVSTSRCSESSDSVLAVVANCNCCGDG